jgi:hypothetical protein
VYKQHCRPSVFQEKTTLSTPKELYAILGQRGGKNMGSIDYNVDYVAKWLRNIAMVVISISAIFWLFYSLVSSVNKGFGLGIVLFRIIPGLIFLVGAAIAWQWRFIGGIILIILGLFGFFLYLGKLGFGLWPFIYALPSGLPPFAAGCLFLMSWWRANRAKIH